MDELTFAEMLKLALAISAAGGHSFYVRRLLQRLERGELTVEKVLSAFDVGPGPPLDQERAPAPDR